MGILKPKLIKTGLKHFEGYLKIEGKMIEVNKNGG
jgi:hypothetical protein